MEISSKSHIIALIGGKDGVGKSTIASNLALAISKQSRIPTLLVDLDQKSSGEMNMILGMKSPLTLEKLGSFSQAITQGNLKKILAYHPSGLAYLSGVHAWDQQLNSTVSMLQKGMYQLSQFFPFIIVDLGSEITPLQQEVLNAASACLSVVSSDVFATNQTKRLLTNLSYLPLSLFHLVVNKQTAQGLNPSLISRNLGRPVLATLPEDPSHLSLLHSSKPFILNQAQSLWTKELYNLAGKLNAGFLQRGKQMGRTKAPPSVKVSQSSDVEKAESAASKEQKDAMTLFRLQIHSELIKEMDLKKDLTKAKDEASKRELRDKTKATIARLVDLRGQNLSREERANTIKHVLDESLGLGVLEELLADPSVTEIMVNGCDQIFCERSGKVELSSLKITSNKHLRNIIERIVTPLGRRIDEKTPYVDARLADGSRVNAVIEPLAMDGPCVTIRKFPVHQITFDDLVKNFGSLTKEMGNFLKICVEQGLNIVISGGTGSGKTTFLNMLSGFIPYNERIVTVEDAAELQLKQEHVVRLETRPPNIEGGGEVTIRDLIKNSLRMRPDRIVVGECRDGAALDMLSAMNTGHDGSLTTVHANTPRQLISRLETLCLMAGMELPAKAIREQIAGAVDLVVQIARLGDGSRKVLYITEVVGMQGDVVSLQDVFLFKEQGFTKQGKITGQFQASGVIPNCVEKFEKRGLKIPRSLFVTKDEEEKKQSSSPSPSSPRVNRVKKPSPTFNKIKRKVS